MSDQTQVPPGVDPGAFEQFAQIPGSGPIKRLDAIDAAKGQTTGAFSAVPPRTTLRLFNPESAPIHGMFSALTPSALKPGQFSLIQDFRFDDGSLTSRYGDSVRTLADGSHVIPNSSGASWGRGFWTGFLNGTYYIVGCWYNGSSVGIYYSTNGTTWTEATASSGAFGDNHMTDTGLPFSFVQITNPNDKKDYLIIQNGTDVPHAFSTSALYSQKVFPINQYSAPTWASNQPVYGNLIGTIFVGIAADNPTVTASSAGDFNMTFGGAGLKGYWILTANTTIAASPTIKLALPYAPTLNSNQLIIAADNYNTAGGGAAVSVWQNMKLEVSHTGAFAGEQVVIYDPVGVTSTNNPLEYPWASTAFGVAAATGGLNGEELIVYNIAQYNFGQTSYAWLRLTYDGTTPGSNQTVNIHGIMLGGSYLAFTEQFTLAYAGLNGLSESAGVVMPPTTATNQILGNMSGTAGITATLPYQAGVYYSYSFQALGPSSTDLNNGCDSLWLYRQDSNVNLSTGQISPVTNGAFYTATGSVGAYSGGAWKWNIPGVSSLQTTQQTGTISYPSALYFTNVNYATDPSRYAPDSYNVCLYTGLYQTHANTRTFVCGNGFYAVSEQNQPTRFRPAIALGTNGQPIARSATYVAIAGQNLKGFATPSASQLNSQTIFFWSQNKTYAIAGFDAFSLTQPSVIAEVGCCAPWSIVQYKDAIWWLDDNYQIRKFMYGRAFLYGYSNAYGYDLMPAISKRVVDDQTRGIPTSRLANAFGVASFDRYYLSYTPNGGSFNTRTLVFDETVGGFVQDTTTVGMEAVKYADLSTGRVLVYQGSDGAFYTHEDVNSSTPHKTSVTTGMITDKVWGDTFYGRVGMVADTQPSFAITSITNASPPVATTATHYLTDGQAVTQSGTSVAALNGTFYAHVLTPTTYSLYKDSALSVPLPLPGGVSNGGNTQQLATVTKTGLQGQTDATTIDVGASATGQVWRWDTKPSYGLANTQGGFNGLGAQVNIFYSMAPNTKIYSLVIETAQARPNGADQL